MATNFAFFLPLAAILLAITAVGTTARVVPAVFVFGDSIFDVGNNNYLPGNESKANHPHYGVDFPGGVPTGRFSNGYNGADFLAKMMGFRQSPPPYLSISNVQEILDGVSFASGGSGILDITGQNSSISMNTQIKFFENTTKMLKQSLGPEKTADLLSKSMFVFSTGNNDLFLFLAQCKISGLQNTTQKDKFVSLLRSNFTDQLQRIYNLGARKFAIIGLTRLGCVPFVRAMTPTGVCVDDLSDLALRHNNETVALLHDLSSKLEGMKYSFANAFTVISDVLSEPSEFGYDVVDSACCGDGRLNVETGCSANSSMCLKRKKFLFWDGAHPTQKTYRLVAKYAYKGSENFTIPINIHKLVKS